MSKRKADWYTIALILVILTALILLFFQNVQAITGHATSANTISNVTIIQYFSMALCSNLSAGIYFGNIASLPAVGQNATWNYWTNGSGVNVTRYCVNISTDSNTAIDLCTYASDHLKTAANDQILIGNESYTNTTGVTTAEYPNASALSKSFSTVSTLSASAVPIGSLAYYRFYLNVSVGQAVGEYNNTINFVGKNTGVAC